MAIIPDSFWDLLVLRDFIEGFLNDYDYQQSRVAPTSGTTMCPMRGRRDAHWSLIWGRVMQHYAEWAMQDYHNQLPHNLIIVHEILHGL